MTKIISSIGYEIPGKSDSLIDFSSKQSLMDSDIILISPELPWYERSSANHGSYLGKTCYGETGSFQLKEDISHWKKEMINALNAGKTVFLMLSSKEDFYVDTGSRTYSGNGRNRSTTINVTNYHNYQLLPINIGTIHSANGKEIFSTGNPLFGNLFKSLASNFEYQVYLENIEGTPIFVGKDKSKILGAIYKVGSGHLVVLPYLNYDREKFIKHKKDKDNKETAYWTEKALEFGYTLGNSLIEIDIGLTEESAKTPPPVWLLNNIFNTEKESIIQNSINQNLKKIKDIENVNEELRVELEKEQILKDLLFEQGKPLEIAVIEALEIIGYKAENYNDGKLELDQVIQSPEGFRYIGECEGKDNKDIDITKFRQLLESMSADFAREEVEEKAFGILFGNAQRLLPPEERTLDFTEKCKIGANREKIALIKTIDLFNVANFLKKIPDENFQKKCRDAIHFGLGNIVKFPDIQEENK